MKNHTLYYFATCPFCIKVLAYLKLKGIEVEMKNIRQDETAYDELVQGGGLSQVPCLKFERDGKEQWMYESDDIIEYLSKHAV